MTRRMFDDLREGLMEAAAIGRGEADPASYREHLRPELDVKVLEARLEIQDLERGSACFETPAKGQAPQHEDCSRMPKHK